MTEKVTPLGWRVLIHREPPEEATDAGIIIMSDTKNREHAAETRGTIVAIGAKAWEDDPAAKKEMQVGDTVLIRMYSGAKVTDEDYGDILVNDQDIIAKVESEE